MNSKPVHIETYINYAADEFLNIYETLWYVDVDVELIGLIIMIMHKILAQLLFYQVNHTLYNSVS